MAMSYPPQTTPEYTPTPVTETNVWAIVSLVSAVLSWLGFFGLGGVAAVITGHIAKNQIRASAGRQSGDGLATAGLVLGYLNIALVAIGLCLLVLVMVGAISAPFLCMPFTNTFEFR